MAFNNVISDAVLSQIDYVLNMNDKPLSVCEFGNQTLKNEFSRKKYFSSKGLSDSCSSTKDFYLKIGLEKYLAIDVNSRMDAICMDLNLDFEKHYSFTEKFNLVTNAGTGEHIFNQYTVFNNMHNVTKKDGIMIHVLPSFGWIDHGFYNFQPNLFKDLAKENSYTLIDLYFTQRNTRVKNLNRNEDALVVCILQKNNVEEFRIPQQGVYSGDNIETDEISSRYRNN